MVSVVAVAQLVESRIVIPAVVGSSPISHPTRIGKWSLPAPFSFYVPDGVGDGIQGSVPGGVGDRLQLDSITE